ncbi:MAG TPA: [FeFe] hydrogenase H-cluster radical SAM maturase HydG, partial [Negativicutes bacterium]|nr:[FeFe] hydrogenase H-cluster radical SAM maturase HydG [Negativicutes bacterium]
MKQTADFINEELIGQLLGEGRGASRQRVEEIIEKARGFKGLSPAEVATLIQVEDPDLLEKIYQTAKEVKEHIYG